MCLCQEVGAAWKSSDPLSISCPPSVACKSDSRASRALVSKVLAEAEAEAEVESTRAPNGLVLNGLDSEDQ